MLEHLKFYLKLIGLRKSIYFLAFLEPLASFSLNYTYITCCPTYSYRILLVIFVNNKPNLGNKPIFCVLTFD